MSKPTVEELERILSGETSVDIEILPNGEIKEVGRKDGETNESLIPTEKIGFSY